jgi:hypothetical protein
MLACHLDYLIESSGKTDRAELPELLSSLRMRVYITAVAISTRHPGVTSPPLEAK